MAVLVSAPSRLHLGFIPPVKAGALPGSAAVSLDAPRVSLEMKESEELHVSGRYAGEFFSLASSFIEEFSPGKGADITVTESISRHVGLGSGTRMALSVGMGLSALYGLELSPYEISDFYGRAKNSRAGLECLIHGGLSLVFQDRASHLSLPDGWMFIVAIPSLKHDFYGTREQSMMRNLGDMKPAGTDLVSALEMAVRAGDIDEAGRLLGEIDRYTGEWFRDFQGGAYTHEVTEKVVETAKKYGAASAGQSSWGPAVYILSREGDADAIINAITAVVQGQIYGTYPSKSGIEVRRT